ncbi:MAG: DUF1674 domain-containing protein [Halofilum sp. (in: g-proteobacteria)]|nr:DUF1674 domain-containing protein [Halofilum sp. (in: g-proteobacteria)]
MCTWSARASAQRLHGISGAVDQPARARALEAHHDGAGGGGGALPDTLGQLADDARQRHRGALAGDPEAGVPVIDPGERDVGAQHVPGEQRAHRLEALARQRQQETVAARQQARHCEHPPAGVGIARQHGVARCQRTDVAAQLRVQEGGRVVAVDAEQGLVVQREAGAAVEHGAGGGVVRVIVRGVRGGHRGYPARSGRGGAATREDNESRCAPAGKETARAGPTVARRRRSNTSGRRQGSYIMRSATSFQAHDSARVFPCSVSCCHAGATTAQCFDNPGGSVNNGDRPDRTAALSDQYTPPAERPAFPGDGEAARGRRDGRPPAPATGETGGPKGPEPTRYGDWERKGRCIDF